MNSIGIGVKRIISSTLVLMMFFLLSNQGYVVHAESLPTYEKAYTIGNILSDYQYFVQGNFVGIGGAHCVGAVAVGGTLNTSNTVGDGQVAASYAGKIENICDFSQGSWFDNPELSKYKEYKVGKFYCDTIGTGVPGWLASRFTQNSGYINFDTAFNSLKQESKAWSDKGTNSYSVDGGKLTITLDSAKDTFVTIPYSVLSSASSIKIAGINSLQDLVEHKYVISCTGVESNNYKLSFSNIQFNGQAFNNKLKDLVGGANGAQINLNGMKLVWNFPDATGNLTAEGLSGHFVAPQADVSISGGNFEGGIIAKTVNTDSEGHYYTFYKPGTTPETTSEPVVQPVNVAPTVDNYEKTVEQNKDLNGTVVGKDENVGDTLTYSKAEEPKHGNVTVNKDGSYTYAPNKNYVGEDSFKVTVSDGNGGSATSTIKVTVKETPVVQPVNVAPTVDNYEKTVEQNKE